MKVDVDENQEIAAVAGVSVMYVSISTVGKDKGNIFFISYSALTTSKSPPLINCRPTFQFFKASKKVAELKSANPSQLEALTKQHQGPVDDASGSGSSSGSVAGLVPGHGDLTEQVTLNQVDCLNQHTSKNVRNALKVDETFLESDVDEQLIISVPFNQVWTMDEGVLETEAWDEVFVV